MKHFFASARCRHKSSCLHNNLWLLSRQLGRILLTWQLIWAALVVSTPSAGRLEILTWLHLKRIKTVLNSFLFLSWLDLNSSVLILKWSFVQDGWDDHYTKVWMNLYSWYEWINIQNKSEKNLQTRLWHAWTISSIHLWRFFLVPNLHNYRWTIDRFFFLRFRLSNDIFLIIKNNCMHRLSSRMIQELTYQQHLRWLSVWHFDNNISWQHCAPCHLWIQHWPAHVKFPKNLESWQT